MLRELILTKEADADVINAYVWYELQRTGLGDELLSSLEARLASITQNPEQYEPLVDSYRRALVRRFLYAVIFESSDERVTVYGVFHCSLDEQKWKQRISRGS